MEEKLILIVQPQIHEVNNCTQKLKKFTTNDCGKDHFVDIQHSKILKTFLENLFLSLSYKSIFSHNLLLHDQ